MNVSEARNFLCVTGSIVVFSSMGVTNTFNSLSGLRMRPIAHTCDCVPDVLIRGFMFSL